MLKALIYLLRKDYKVQIMVNRLKRIDRDLACEYDNNQRMILLDERETIISALKKMY